MSLRLLLAVDCGWSFGWTAQDHPPRLTQCDMPVEGHMGLDIANRRVLLRSISMLYACALLLLCIRVNVVMKTLLPRVGVLIIMIGSMIPEVSSRATRAQCTDTRAVHRSQCIPCTGHCRDRWSLLCVCCR